MGRDYPGWFNRTGFSAPVNRPPVRWKIGHEDGVAQVFNANGDIAVHCGFRLISWATPIATADAVCSKHGDMVATAA